MLFKNIWKVALATALGLGLLLGGTSAMAQNLNFDPPAAAPNVPLTLSRQSWAPTDRFGTTSPAFYNVDISAQADGRLEAFVEPGILHTIIDENTNLYLRYDFGPHVKLRAQPTAQVENDQSQTVSNTDAEIESELTDGYLLVQFRETDDSDPIQHNSRLLVDFDDALASSGRGAAIVRVRAFASALDAIAIRNALFDHSMTLFDVADSATVVVKPGMTAIAEVEANFRQFKGSPPLIRLGSFNLQLAQTATGAPATVYAVGADGGSPVQPGSTIPAIGTGQDFITFMAFLGIDVAANSVGTATGTHTVVSGEPGFAFAMRTTFCNVPDSGAPLHHPSAGSLTFGEDDAETKAGPAMGVVAWHEWHLCFTMSPANMVSITEGNYYLDVNLKETDPKKPFPMMGVSEAHFGTIERNGTTVHIPYLTSYENYVQRLVIRNRNKMDVDWNIEFQTESDGMVTTHIDSGQLLGESTTMMRVHEMVTFEGPTRGSATLTIVSDPKQVDVITTQVASDGSTDTVVYHRGLHEGHLQDN